MRLLSVLAFSCCISVSALAQDSASKLSHSDGGSGQFVIEWPTPFVGTWTRSSVTLEDTATGRLVDVPSDRARCWCEIEERAESRDAGASAPSGTRTPIITEYLRQFENAQVGGWPIESTTTPDRRGTVDEHEWFRPDGKPLVRKDWGNPDLHRDPGVEFAVEWGFRVWGHSGGGVPHDPEKLASPKRYKPTACSQRHYPCPDSTLGIPTGLFASELAGPRETIERAPTSDTELQDWLNQLAATRKAVTAIIPLRPGTSLFVVESEQKRSLSPLVLLNKSPLGAADVQARLRVHPGRRFVGIHTVDAQATLFVFY